MNSINTKKYEFINSLKKDFSTFLDDLIEDHPDLVLKYQISKEMESSYIIARIRQDWNNEKFNIDNFLYSLHVIHLNFFKT